MISKSHATDVRGKHYEGRIACNAHSGARSPGVLVIHEATGFGKNVCEVADRLCKETGYTVYAMDLFGETPASSERMMEIIGALLSDPAELDARLTAGLDTLSGHESVDPTKLAVMGYCFGGTAALELARRGAALRAAIAFHAILKGTDRPTARPLKPKILVCNGAQDPWITSEMKSAFATEMISADADWQMHLHGTARHSFTNRAAATLGSPAYAYNQDADRRSWVAMRSLLEEAFA